MPEMLECHKQVQEASGLDLQYVFLKGDTPPEFAKPQYSLEWIRTPEQLEKLIERLNEVPLFAIDTETAGTPDLSEHLCLIQIGLPEYRMEDGEFIVVNALKGESWLIDVLALEGKQPDGKTVKGGPVNPLTAMKELMENPDIAKIIQHADFEKQQFGKYQVGIENIADTERMAKKIRPDLMAYNLASLAVELCGISISKEEQTSQWDARPLSDSQIFYAAFDPEITFIVWHKVEELFAEAEESATSRMEGLDVEDLIKLVYEIEQERQAMLEDSGFEQDIRVLRAQAEKYRVYLKETRLPAEYEKLQESGDLKDGEGYEYKGNYGSAYYKPQPIYEADEEEMDKIDPTLSQDVFQESVTKKDIESYVSEHSLDVSADEIWKKIRKTEKERTDPKFTLKLSTVGSDSLEEEMVLIEDPVEMSVPDILRAAAEAELSAVKLLRTDELGNKLGALNWQEERVKEEIKELLIKESGHKENPVTSYKHQCDYGVASFTTKAVSTTDIQVLRDDYPEIAAGTVKAKSPSKKSVEEALRERGFSPATTAKLMERVYPETGEYKNPSPKVFPAYASFYKGKSDDKSKVEEQKEIANLDQEPFDPKNKEFFEELKKQCLDSLLRNDFKLTPDTFSLDYADVEDLKDSLKERGFSSEWIAEHIVYLPEWLEAGEE